MTSSLAEVLTLILSVFALIVSIWSYVSCSRTYKKIKERYRD